MPDLLARYKTALQSLLPETRIPAHVQITRESMPLDQEGRPAATLETWSEMDSTWTTLPLNGGTINLAVSGNLRIGLLPDYNGNFEIRFAHVVATSSSTEHLGIKADLTVTIQVSNSMLVTLKRCPSIVKNCRRHTIYQIPSKYLIYNKKVISTRKDDVCDSIFYNTLK
jgi:hypothetical protein